jgi:predicted neuraminidase
MVGSKKQLTDPGQHLLGRCGPVVYGNKILLPLYDEVDGRCVIFGGNDVEYGEISRYGDDIIQPTLWADGDKIFSMSRNFRRKIKHTKSQLYCSHDPCVADAWHGPVDTNLWNINNSMQVIRWNGNDLVLWNDTPSQNRSNLTLGTLIDNAFDVEKIDIISSIHGSYPSMCIDGSNNLHMTFTNFAKQIEHVVWTGRKFRNARRNSGYRRK